MEGGLGYIERGKAQGLGKKPEAGLSGISEC